MPARTTKQAIAYADEIGETLTAAGIPYQPYHRPPLSLSVAALAITDGNIRFWPGAANVFVSPPDSTHHQVVLTIDETKRSITRKYLVTVSKWGRGSDRVIAETFTKTKTVSTDLDTRMRAVARETFPVRLTKRTFTNIEFSDIEWSNANRYDDRQNIVEMYHITSFKVNASVDAPGQKQSFLVGMDETSPFIAALPKNVKTVANAHKALRPAGVPHDSPRQGEWFLVPATKAEIKEIEKRLNGFEGRVIEHGYGRETSSYKGMDFRVLEPRSSHHAFTVSVDKNRYAIGPVLDRRTDHHSPLVLKDWHRVVRNLEVTVPSDASAFSQSRRTWD